MKEKYVIWNDGMGISGIGTLVENKDDAIIVKNPCTVVFTAGNEELPGQENVPVEQRKYRGTLRFDIQPYIFGACIASGKNVWKIRNVSTLDQNVELDENLVNAYLRVVATTSKGA